MQKTNLLLRTLFFLAIFPTFLLAQWSKTNGLPGGNCGGFLNFGDTIVANFGDELYFSSNHGQTWVLMPNANSINLLTADTDGQRILGARYDPVIGTRLTISDDFGQTWQAIASADTMLFYEAFLAFGYVYGSDYHGLYRSNDEGATWEYVSHQQITDIQFDGTRITGSRYPNIVQSTDGGLTWSVLLSYSGGVIDMLQHEEHIFAFMQNASHGCYASSDYGQTWKHYTGTGFDQVYSFVWHNGNIFALKGSSVRKSANLGQTWVGVPMPPTATFPAFQGVSAGSAIMMGGLHYESGGILRSTDNGATWFPADFGINASSGKLRIVDNKLYAAGNSGLYQLGPDGINWSKQQLNFPPSQISSYGISDFAKSGDNLLFSNGNNPWVSLDGGTSWTESFYVNSPFSASVSYFEPVGDNIFAWGGNSDFSYHYISSNNGLTFQLAQPTSGQTSFTIRRLCVDQGKAYALSYNKIYRSDDAGEHWELHVDSVPIDSISSFGLADLFMAVSGNVIVLSSNYYPTKSIFSNDGGQTWAVHNSNTSPLPWRDAPIGQMLRIGNYLILATKGGVYLSQNNGTDWSAWNEGLAQLYLKDLIAFDGDLWASSREGGIWKRSLAELNLKPVSGIVFFDQNGNTIQDSGEPSIGNVVVQSISTNSYTNTQADGTFSLLSNLSQEQLKVHPYKPYWIASPASQTVSVPSAGADFALSLNPAAKDLSVDLTNVAVLRPGFETNYLLRWRNNVPLPATGVTVALQYPSDLLELTSAIPAPTSQTGTGTISWHLGDLPAAASGYMLLQFKVPVTDSIGTLICTDVNISPNAGDLSPSDNSQTLCNTVVGSFDPNDKQVEPADVITTAQIENNEALTYTVRFQNTGNFPATFVRIADTLAGNFEPASFQLLSSSHPCSWTLRGQGVLEFFFNNIQLPPSSLDEPGSHGFVKYSVQARNNLPIGTTLTNTAHIYFDYNAPVITNTTTTQIGLVNVNSPATGSSSLRLIPNPASHWVFAETQAQAGELILLDGTGRVVLRKITEDPNPSFSVDGLPNGLYKVVFRTEKTIQHGQLAVFR